MLVFKTNQIPFAKLLKSAQQSKTLQSTPVKQYVKKQRIQKSQNILLHTDFTLKQQELPIVASNHESDLQRATDIDERIDNENQDEEDYELPPSFRYQQRLIKMAALKKNRQSLSNSYCGIASNSSLTTAAAFGRYNPKSTTTRPATAKSSSGSNYRKMPVDLKRYSLKANSSQNYTVIVSKPHSRPMSANIGSPQKKLSKSFYAVRKQKLKS